MYQFILLNSFSLLKRFFVIVPELYGFVKFLPLFLVLGSKISKSGLLSSFILIIALSLSGIEYFMNFAPLVLLLVFSPTFNKLSYDHIIRKTIPFFLIAIVYGMYQVFFGYTFFETAWIASDLSSIGEAGVYLGGTIRPFSFFAGTPEFAFFVSMYMYYFYKEEKKILFLLSFLFLFVIGSRGVLVSVVISLFLINVYGKYNSSKLIVSFLVGALVYIVLTFSGDLVASLGNESRFMVYGTFNARVLIVFDFFDKLNITSFLVGSNYYDSVSVLDNLYLTFLAHFGFLFTVLFLTLFFKDIKSQRQFFFSSIIIIYSFYADTLIGFYLMFNYFFAMKSR
jgi:hypothetical protein